MLGRLQNQVVGDSDWEKIHLFVVVKENSVMNGTWAVRPEWELEWTTCNVEGHRNIQRNNVFREGGGSAKWIVARVMKL